MPANLTKETELITSYSGILSVPEIGKIRKTKISLDSNKSESLPTPTVAFLGPSGTFSQLAAQTFFPSTFQFIPCPTITGVFQSVLTGRTNYGIVPFENSIGGKVHQTIVDLANEVSIIVTGELFLKISHTLACKFRETENGLNSHCLSSIKKVYSHPQALNQCQNFLLTNCPGAQPFPVSSTAMAAKMANEDPESAAISSMSACTQYGLQILKSDIQDELNNTTRFFAIGSSLPNPTQSSEISAGRYETLISFGVENSPGRLAKCLSVFANRNINLTSLDSFPNKEDPKKYHFFVQLDGHPTDESLRRAWEDLTFLTTNQRIVGCFSKLAKY